MRYFMPSGYTPAAIAFETFERLVAGAGDFDEACDAARALGLTDAWISIYATLS